MITTSTDALFLIDKPAGVTSFDAVRVVRRAIGTRRVGHTGTLDPFATGLLVVLSGQGTRLAPYVPDEPKVYRAHIAFGVETTTDDATGEMTTRAPAPSRLRIEEAMHALTGELAQMPPAYSAKRVDGVRAYRVARRGIAPALRPAAVRVDSWEPLDWRDDTLEVRIVCGRGTYVRALARDLGRLTHSAAHCAALRRERCGPFVVEGATSWAALQAGNVATRPLLDALGDIERVILSPDDRQRVSHGARIAASGPGERIAFLHPDGSLLGLGRRDADTWQPHLVFDHA
jgi:tRNA pseudouridine55 synthase